MGRCLASLPNPHECHIEPYGMNKRRRVHIVSPHSYAGMDTAPKDGTPILGWVPSYYQGKGAWVVVLWMGEKGMRDAGWMDNRAWLTKPTHWTPLPSPPATHVPPQEKP